MKCTACSRAERSSPADGDREYFVLSSPSLASSSSLNIVCSRRKRRVFLMCAKFFAHICTISSKLCVEPVVCARRSRILRALIAFSCRQQLIKYRLFTTKTSCFFNVCKVFCTHLHNFFEIVRGACRLRSMPFLASNPSSSLAVSSSMVYFVTGACRWRYCLF